MSPLIATPSCGRLRFPVGDRPCLECILNRADHPQEVADQLDELLDRELRDPQVIVTQNRHPQRFVANEAHESKQNHSTREQQGQPR